MSEYLTLPEGFVDVQTICLPDGTYTPFACGGRWPIEVSWNIPALGIFGGADVVCSPGEATHTTFTIGRERESERVIPIHVMLCYVLLCNIDMVMGITFGFVLLS
jgi:hypothetical protein